MTKSIGHEPEFWNNFKFLLAIAIDNNLYEYIDFNDVYSRYKQIYIKALTEPLETANGLSGSPVYNEKNNIKYLNIKNNNLQLYCMSLL